MRKNITYSAQFEIMFPKQQEIQPSQNATKNRNKKIVKKDR